MLPTAFLTGIKTRKRKREKKRKGNNFFFTYLYARLIQLFFLYMGTADRLTPLVDVATAPQPAPLSVGEGFIFFLDKNEHLDLLFFLYFSKRKEKRKRKKKGGRKVGRREKEE